MSYIPFTQLPSEARLWVFVSDRELGEAESMQLLNEIRSFLERWTAHNEELLAGCELRYNRFLLVATDEAVAKASGCSIDELYRRMRVIAETYGITFVNNLTILYRDTQGAIRSASRADFAGLAANGSVHDETIVFDNGISSVGALRSGKWELPAGESWHAQAFAFAGA